MAEKAPWWGGVFERMVRMTKRCLRKTIGQAKLTYDELLTAIIEIESNQTPLLCDSERHGRATHTIALVSGKAIVKSAR